MSVSVIGIDYENVDGLQKSLEATFKAHQENGVALANLEDARVARLEGRKDGPRQTAPRPAYVHQDYPRHMHHADSRVITVQSAKEQKASEAKGFRTESYPVVRVAPADPAAEKAAKIAQDLETAGKIASQNDLIVKMQAQLAELTEAAKK